MCSKAHPAGSQNDFESKSIFYSKYTKGRNALKRFGNACLIPLTPLWALATFIQTDQSGNGMFAITPEQPQGKN